MDCQLLPTPAVADLDWSKLGRELRDSAEDAFSGSELGVPLATDAYSFLLENPEAFGFEDWPADMPGRANIELIYAYCMGAR